MRNWRARRLRTPCGGTAGRRANRSTTCSSSGAPSRSSRHRLEGAQSSICRAQVTTSVSIDPPRRRYRCSDASPSRNTASSRQAGQPDQRTRGGRRGIPGGHYSPRSVSIRWESDPSSRSREPPAGGIALWLCRKTPRAAAGGERPEAAGARPRRAPRVRLDSQEVIPAERPTLDDQLFGGRRVGHRRIIAVARRDLWPCLRDRARRIVDSGR